LNLIKIEKGELIEKERLKRYSHDRKNNLGWASFFFILSFLIILGRFILMWQYDMPINDMVLELTGLLLFPSISFFVGLWCFFLGYRRVQLEIYENGFIPYSRPIKYVKQGIDYFIKWDDISNIKKLDARKKMEWFYAINTKLNKGYIIGHFTFENGGRKVLEKLEEVKKQLENQGIPNDSKRQLLYDAG
jgi:hypothetical protein